MTSTITCECGAKLRMPAEPAGRALRCPQCKAALALTADAVILRSTPIAIGQAVLCPICQTSIASGEPCVTCPGCDQVHHRECWAEIGGCGTYGCREAPAVDKSENSVQAPLAAWGDTKKCPACGETIKAIALRCRYCQTEFDSVDPLTVNDLRRQAVRSEKTRTFRRDVVILFVLGIFLPCLAPLTLVGGLVYLLPRRLELAKAGPLYVIMGWTAIALSALYCVLIGLFLLFEF